ncbi:MAG: hypothetical protein ACFE0I_05175 [Elainellaceae cyanobacterium]
MRGSSPFSTYDEFYEATGPIYTFADRPAIMGILCVVSALIFLYFIYATYTIKKGHSDAKNPVILGLLIATSVASAADAVYSNYLQRNDHRQANRVTQNVDYQARQHRSNNFQLPALLGVMGIGATASRRRRSSVRRYATTSRKTSAKRRRYR